MKHNTIERLVTFTYVRHPKTSYRRFQESPLFLELFERVVARAKSNPLTEPWPVS